MSTNCPVCGTEFNESGCPNWPHTKPVSNAPSAPVAEAVALLYTQKEAGLTVVVLPTETGKMEALERQGFEWEYLYRAADLVGDDMVMVPREPTEQMIEEAFVASPAFTGNVLDRDDVKQMYEIMLAAALVQGGERESFTVSADNGFPVHSALDGTSTLIPPETIVLTHKGQRIEYVRKAEGEG